MYTVILLIHVVIAIGLVTLVLLQQGRGAEAGAAFGSGASSTVFGSRGSASFLSRITAGLATGFFLTSLVLAYFATQATAPSQSVIDRTNVSAPSPTDTGAGNAEPVASESDGGSGVPEQIQGPADVPQVPQSDSSKN